MNRESAKRALDKANLDKALNLLRRRMPLAVAVDLQTSDGGLYGFRLEEVWFADGIRASDIAPESLTDLDDETWPDLSDIDWDGVVGEDDGGFARIQL